MYKILIAEDEPEMRNLLVKYIKNAEPDLEVVGSAENGHEALRIAEERRPDIVITDICMPCMDGLEFLAETARRSIPLKVIIISGYDEFEYAKKAISLGVSDYLLKPFDPSELREVLDKIKNELERQKILVDNMELLREEVDSGKALLKERALKDILSGKENLKEPAEWILDTSGDYYCACLLKLPLYLASQVWRSSRQEYLEELMKIWGSGCMSEDIQVCGLCMEDYGIVLILVGKAAQRQHFLLKVKNGMRHLKESMEKYYDISLICVVGRICDSWRSLSLSYGEALKAWRATVSIEKELIICDEGRGQALRSEFADSSKKIRDLKEHILLAVRMGLENDVAEYLSELMQIYAFLDPGNMDFVSMSAGDLVYEVFSEMEKKQIAFEDCRTNEEVQRQIMEQLQCASLLDIRELLRKYLEKSVLAFHKAQERQPAEILVENIKEWIESNLDYEGLTLEWVAQKIHFSSTYVRQIFKQWTGERVMEYVIRRRMEKAADLLLRTDMKIQDIALTCGYSNQRYFASSFKKYYNCTPTDFKNIMSHQEEMQNGETMD